MRLVLLIHRYLGVGVGLLVLVWCLSGFVMMRQGFPELTDAERIRGLESLSLARCCALPPLDPATRIEGFSVEMAGEVPVLRLAMSGAPALAFDLTSGAPLVPLGPDQALAAARAYAERHGLRGTVRHLGVIETDQWIVASAARNAPVHHLAVGDALGTELYVNGTTGRLFQKTTAAERRLAWFGAIPHWIYPLQLRQNPPLWRQVVIWTAVLGVFLAATGLYVGLAALRRRPAGRPSPYRGVSLWHHLAGLAFGVLTLTWTVSGLLTMNPWGLLERAPDADLPRAITGGPVAWAETARFLEAAPFLRLEETVQLRSAPLAGDLFVIAESPSGATRRYDAGGGPARLTRGEVALALGESPAPLAELDLITREDAFHAARRGPVALPAYRARFADPDRQRLYIDAATGEVLRHVDGAARRRRWLVDGLHTLDLPGLRGLPAWPWLVNLLLAGVTVSAAAGVWLAGRRIGRDISQRRPRRLT